MVVTPMMPPDEPPWISPWIHIHVYTLQILQIIIIIMSHNLVKRFDLVNDGSDLVQWFVTKVVAPL